MVQTTYYYVGYSSTKHKTCCTQSLFTQVQLDSNRSMACLQVRQVAIRWLALLALAALAALLPVLLNVAQHGLICF